jgi:hypothetical protein
MKTAMVILLTMAMAITSSAWALNCPDESLIMLSDDGVGNYSFSYSCDDGVSKRVIHIDTSSATDENIVEMALGKKCLSFKPLNRDEVVFICR